jgi:hypothetical protein
MKKTTIDPPTRMGVLDLLFGSRDIELNPTKNPVPMGQWATLLAQNLTSGPCAHGAPGGNCNGIGDRPD